jgi:hypothetical protein
MIGRCRYPRNNRYKNYGARGICVCKEWESDFKTFYDWAIANGYIDGLTLDRVDVNGNYEPSNCRWATYQSQGMNRTNNHLITLNGVTHTLCYWADFYNIDRRTVYTRLRNGWDIEDALCKPVNEKKRNKRALKNV